VVVVVVGGGGTGRWLSDDGAKGVMYHVWRESVAAGGYPSQVYLLQQVGRYLSRDTQVMSGRCPNAPQQPPVVYLRRVQLLWLRVVDRGWSTAACACAHTQNAQMHNGCLMAAQRTLAPPRT
jgi:hypothetical protein